jgi:argininosuccinate synthase
MTMVAPPIGWAFAAREASRYGGGRGVPFAASAVEKSIDATLWGRVVRCRSIEGAAEAADRHVLTRAPTDTPDDPAFIEVSFEGGRPIGVNGVAMSPVELIGSLETMAGVHGIGRLDLIERQPAGGTVRLLCEAPAAVVLAAAHADLLARCIGADDQDLVTHLGETYAALARDGLWHTAAREAIDALVGRVQRAVTGSTRLRLFKGQCTVVTGPVVLTARPDGRREPAMAGN